MRSLSSLLSDAMTTDKDNVKIELNIAGESLLISVPFSTKSSVKQCENEINRQYAEWRHKYPRKNPSELLAMLAYKYASYYMELRKRLDNMNTTLEAVNSDLHYLLDNHNDNN